MGSKSPGFEKPVKNSSKSMKRGSKRRHQDELDDLDFFDIEGDSPIEPKKRHSVSPKNNKSRSVRTETIPKRKTKPKTTKKATVVISKIKRS
mmetsp:Transcript_24084/g.23118  ORF Transcript_24084/g.23118 Transcript_24084/m.23118 type:complete len:92 (-) Transcript_24084:133-408(-)